MDLSDIGSGLADAGSSLLHGIGTVLDTPRRLLYGAGNAVAHGLGYEGPDVNHFSDLLTKLGMDPDSTATHALGFIGDMATDPLTYAGGAAARYARGLLPGSEMAALGRASAGGAAEGLANQAFKQELGGITKFRNARYIEPAESAAGGLTPEMGGELFRDGGQALGISQPMYESGNRLTAEVARGRNLPNDTLLNKLSDMGDLGELSGQAREGSYAVFRPQQQAQIASPGISWAGAESLPGGAQEAARIADRHEAIHGIIDNARRMGTTGDLPLPMRIAAQLPATYDPAASGAAKALGLVANETAAHALEHRGTLNQLVGGANFLFSPERNAQYVDQIKGLSPLIGKLYGYLPNAMVDAGYGAGAGAGALGRGMQ